MSKLDYGFQIFIDDCGNKEFNDPYDENNLLKPEAKDLDFWRRNYFVALGLIVKNKNIPIISKEIVELKKTTFETPLVEIKSLWLRNTHYRRKKYIDPHRISDEVLNEFGRNICGLFKKYKKAIKIICAIVDKRYYKERRINDPFCNSFQVIFERCEYIMNAYRDYCILVIDQMENTLSPKRGRNGELIDVLLNKRALKHTFVKEYSRIKDISFRKSHNDNLIQLADIAAYNVYRQFVEYGRDWEDVNLKELRTYSYFANMQDNFFQKEGRIQGVSICKLPDSGKRNWIP